MTPAQRASHAGRTLHAYGHGEPLPVNVPVIAAFAAVTVVVAGATWIAGRVTRRPVVITVTDPEPDGATVDDATPGGDE